MDKSNLNENNTPFKNETTDEDTKLSKNKTRTRAKKRKRLDSESSTDIEDILPENSLEVEKNLHASAIKNNLDEVSVKKILKKVVTNDHVLALVKIREEEEDSGAEERSPGPKLTRAKMKELMKVSPDSAPWNLELTPIKGIPVKTRPEVKALIGQELHEDEDDDEYQPTHEEAQSDDDQTMESCSDLESQPRTPATPGRKTSSPKVVQDGPFKVPQDLTPARKKLIIDEEEATIALRTRSKLSLSATPIEHIESSFVPPDALPLPAVDDLWNEFLKECLDPASVTRNEEDDEADPEYNVAADADAHDEDEEALENSIIKISRKELSDLVTELFNVMPSDDALAAELPANGLAGHVPVELVPISNHWDGKQEPVSDDEGEERPQRITFDKRATRYSIGKSEPEDPDYHDVGETAKKYDTTKKAKGNHTPPRKRPSKATVNISVVERSQSVEAAPAPRAPPPPLLRGLQTAATTELVQIRIENGVCLLPEQVLILQQQLRQHVQLAACNYLQLYVHPVHWTLAPAYKEYLEQLDKLLEANAESVVNVCNLEPALELVDSWEKSVSADTPDNKKMVEFMQREVERSRRRFSSNSVYVGDFAETFKRVVANSSVFLYPYLLPSVPYRADTCRRFGYRLCEDELMVLGLDQFWQYVEDNPDIYKLPARRNPRQRYGLNATAHLVCKYMFPWLAPRYLLCHIHKARKEKDSPIYRFFEKREVSAVKHKLLPFNPRLTLYEQPEHEMPRIWVRYLAKSSKRFMDHLYKRKNSGAPPTEGVVVKMGSEVRTPQKNPLPIDFTKSIISTRANVREKAPVQHVQDKYDIQVLGNVGPDHLFVLGNVASKENIPSSSNVPAMGNGQMLRNVIPLSNLYTPANGVMMNSSGGNAAITPNNLAQGNVPGNVEAKGVTPISTRSNTTAKLTLFPATNGSITTPKIVTTDNAEVNSMGNVTENVLTPKADVTSSVTAGNRVTMGNVLANDLPAVSSMATANVGNNTVTGNVAQATPTPFVVSNMYRVVETSTGSYLVPLVVHQTSTVDAINSPITSVAEKTSTVVPNDMPEKSTVTIPESDEQADGMDYHCKCCVLLRKICKKQTFITDFFKPKCSERKCECNERRYPRISKKLKLLVNSYKSRSWCVHRELQARLNTIKEETKDDNHEECMKEIADDACDLNDIAAVTSYQLKLTIRTNVIRNTLLKKRVNCIFSKFDPECGDAVLLAEELYKAFEVDVVDLYKEFLGFLTAEQADKIDKFKDYFIQNCAEDLMKKVDEEVKDNDRKCEILSHLSGMFVDSISTACEMCAGLLATLEGHPKLAGYVFSLFPHKAGKKKKKKDIQEPVGFVSCNQKHSTAVQMEKENPKCLREEAAAVQQDYEIELELEVEHGDDSLTICDASHTAVDYEADHSSCGEDDISDRGSEGGISQGGVNSPHDQLYIKVEPENVIDTPELTISKTEIQDPCDSSDMSMIIESDSDNVKSEPAEWKREEDKLILEVLMHHLTPQEREDKTILEIIEERDVYQLILEILSHKSVYEIRERVLYLLKVLSVSEK